MDSTPTLPPAEHGYLMNDIIKQVNTLLPKIDGYHEKLIYIDRNSKETSYSKPWWHFWSEWAVFWVTSQKYVMLKNYECIIDDMQGGEFLKIDIKSRIQFIQGSEYKAVTLLYKEYNLDEGVKNLIKNWIKQFAAKHQHIVKNYFSIENELMQYVASEGEKHGIKIELFLSPFKGEITREEYAVIKETFPCQIKDWEIKIMYTLVMHLWDERRYRMARIENIEKWMKEKMIRISQGILINKTIGSLLQQFPSKEILARLEAEAYDIGFRVKQVISVPLLDAFELLKGFHFETEFEDEPNTIYYTQDVRVPVCLNVSIKGRIRSFEGKISKHLKPGVNLVNRMRDAVRDRVRFFMKTTSAEQFYFNFSSAFYDKGIFDQLLEREISGLLREEFNAENLSILLTPQETELTERLRQLQGRFSFFTVQNISKQIAYVFHFSISGVAREGWHIFKSRIYDEFARENMPVRDILKNSASMLRLAAEEELVAVGSTLRQHIEMQLNASPFFDVIHPRNGSATEEVIKLFREVTKVIPKTHGLEVTLIAVERLPVGDDENYKTQVAEIVVVDKSEKSKALLNDIVNNQSHPLPLPVDFAITEKTLT